ncbi:MAG: dienelactone hydrolase family protein [Candidatus Marinimicrobia bacterium]|nr:dienelactone hydrolase family protein [Candidatus Neomarinimicrobiota bacterium]
MQNHDKPSLHLVSPVFISLFCFVINVVLAKSSEIYTEEVVYYKNQKNVVGYLARPIDGKRYPAILLIHEWWGLNENIKERARQFAGQGYVALAVDLYGGRVTTTASEAINLAGEVRNNRNDAFDNLKGAVEFLQSQSLFVIPDRIASIGWCFGGGWSFEMAKNNLGVKASVIYPRDFLTVSYNRKFNKL